MTSQSIEIAIDELRECANIILQMDNTDRVRFHISLALGRLAQVIETLDARLDALEGKRP